VIPYDLPPTFILVWLFLYGAVLGSFLTVCVDRLPRHENVFAAWHTLWDKPSHCDRCQKRLLARDNVPIFGWLWLGGRCRFCKRRIPPRYPLIELTNGLLFVLVYVLEVPLTRSTPLDASCLHSLLRPSFVDLDPSGRFNNAFGMSAVAMFQWQYLYHLVLVEALFVASLIDWDLMIIPDSVTLPPMLTGIVGAATFAEFWLVPVWFQDPIMVKSSFAWLTVDWQSNWAIPRVPGWIGQHPHWHGLASSLAGLLVGGGIVWTVRIIGQLALRREAMGFGDVVLMAMVGSFVGWQPVVVAFFVAPILALATLILTRVLRFDREIPYGPYLSVGTLVVVLGWKWIFPFAERYFSHWPLLILMALVMAAGLFPALYLFRWIKLAFGIPLYPGDELFEEWTSADQLFHFSGETVDRQQGQWRTDSWPGDSAARGQRQSEQWRRPRNAGGRPPWSR
jgi:leader peptidase (prepilin peptidase) / N-methyltransferase